MKNLLLYLVIASFIFSLGFFFREIYVKYVKGIPIIPVIDEVKVKPLEKYAIDRLSQTDIQSGIFEIKDTLKETDDFNSYLFSFEFDPNLDGKTNKNVTGQINLPKIGDSFPLIIMFRGYIDKTLFRTGDGTRNAASYFAENGFITIAPDFLGYGGSDKESGNIFETRFQTYITAVSLIKTLEHIKFSPQSVSGPDKVTNQLINHSSLFLWGHSNGGQIALTTLEITGSDYPTTLWAPVSKPFPYSVLYYTDESEDRGKLIRSELSKFEEDYDVELYSLTNYLDRINAPIQIHQGALDEAVPKIWSDTLVNLLKQKEKDVIYYTYPGTDHNMRPSWDTVVELDLEFFKQNINI